MPRKKKNDDVINLPTPTKSTRVRSRQPKNHAEGKPVRGIRPGVRGPARTANEVAHPPKVIVIPALPPDPATRHATGNYAGQGYKPGESGRSKPLSPNSRNQKLNRQLQDLVREIGNEVVDPNTGWTRIVAVIRRLYADAMMGKTPATNLLLERGWGKVPTPIQMDMRAEVEELIESTGLTHAEIESDPVLKQLMGDVIEGSFRREDVNTDNGTAGNAGTGLAGQPDTTSGET